ncbi:MAG: 50S ribosomal protein L37e [Candidatus Aenigmarchaeota archaeon]|nr:50S ribosomal protein L37e [Candidatus Aenigmarchaeota archaeon]
MTKGTSSFGKHNKKTHMRCRRCGRYTYHLQKSKCAACGFGRSPKMRDYSWRRKTVQRKRKL